jgi:hypothetical protein
MKRCGLAGLGASLLTLFALTASASADIPFCPPGSGAGQCNAPKGLATDWETGHVYVVDQGNHRINVFESDGTFPSSFGSAQLESPTWVAVDNDPTSTSHHDVYVAADDFEVQKFKASGEFVESFGGKGEGPCQLMSTQDPVAVEPGGVVSVADSYDKDGEGSLNTFVNRVQQFDSEGKCIGEIKLFEGENQTVGGLAVDSLGNFYVSVAGAGGVIRKYSPTGTLIADLGGEQTEGLSVDAADNVFAKQRGSAVTKSASMYFIAEYAPNTSLVKRFGYLPGLVAGTSLAALEGSGVGEGVFATEGFTASEGAVRVNFLPIPDGPVIVPEPCHVKPGALGSVRATLQAEVNPEGKETTVHVEYSGGGETKSSPPQTLETSPPETPGAAVDFELHEAAVTITGLKPETTYHCKFVAENADGTTPLGQEGEFETREGFEFGPATVTKVSTEAATLNATGNPLGLPATAQIEYVTDAQYQAAQPGHGFDEALIAPEELDYGAGETPLLRSLTLTGLAPATTYQWRLRVKNGVPPQGLVCPRSGPEPCPANEHVFRTYGLAEAPDDRGYELVSPGQKNSAEVANAEALASGVYEDRNMLIQVSSGSGEAATYTSFTSFGKDAEGAPSASQYLSKRTAAGWATENISPFGFQFPVLSIPFKGFDPELGRAVFKVSSGALAPGCPEGVENLYLRDNATGTLTCLTPEVPQAKSDFSCFNYAGSSGDGSRVFFASGASYAGAPESNGYSLYEWSAGVGLKPISILPGQSAPVAPTRASTFGSSLNPSTPNADINCQFGQTIMRHVVSADGTKAFWTFVPEALASLPPGPPGTRALTLIGGGEGTFFLEFKGQHTPPIALDASAAAIQGALESLSTIGAGNIEVTGSGPFTVTFKGSLAGTSEQLSAHNLAPTRLLAHIDGAKTVQLDAEPAAQAGKGPYGNGVFQAASKDGSVVYFTAPGRLTKDSKAEAGKPDLYRYDFAKTAPLSDLTKGSVPGNVQGVVGASDDGSYIYFVAKAVLSEEEGPTGQKAIEGANNLYLNHEGKTSFIAQLSIEDFNDWASQPKNLSARVTPDGRHLAFLSHESQALVGYENTIAQGLHCQQALNERTLSGGPLCTQAFLYDAEADALNCASCNPTGERPLGPAALPPWSNVYEGPRYLSDDGQRLFFESFDALAEADENGLRDVYEFERPGTGTCTIESGTFDPVSGGCHFLISSGKSAAQSYLLDASSNGRDVFFSTRSQLVGWDPNENYDVYDYREGGGFPEPAEPQVCLGEACKAPAPAVPTTAAPASPSFFGPGNATAQKPKPRHKKHKKHRKAKKKAHVHKKGARR